jgi:serine/threonine-protein kinase
MRPVCLAVAEAHKQGVIHRDLKPSNVFLVNTSSREQLVKVVDFGIALLQNLPNGSMRITQADTTVGTPLYLSPEQATGKFMDKRSDIYSLGIVFYELLTGAPPFIGSNYHEVLMSHMSEKPRPIKQLAPIEDWLAKLVMSMLAKRPAERPQSMEEIIKVIDQTRV